MAVCLRKMFSQWKLKQRLPANERKMEAEKRGGKVEHEKTRSVSWPSTVTPQAELEDPGLQRYLEASKLLCLVALGSLAFPSSVALIAKEATDIASQGLQS